MIPTTSAAEITLAKIMACLTMPRLYCPAQKFQSEPESPQPVFVT
jgi:hypothetical protein